MRPKRNTFRWICRWFVTVCFVWTILIQRRVGAQPQWDPDDIECLENPCENGGVCLNIRRPGVGRVPVSCSRTSCYKIFRTTPSAWLTARSTCQQNDGLLISFTNDTELNYVVQYLLINDPRHNTKGSINSEFWTSGVYNSQQSRWVWNSTSEVVFLTKIPKPHSNHSEPHCLSMNSSPDPDGFNLRFYPCSQQKHFICEVSKETLVKEWTYACHCPEHYYGYHCEHHRELIKLSLCEGEYLNISCPNNLNIFIMKATFVPGDEQCSGSNTTSTNPLCTYDLSITSWLRTECDGHNSCEKEVTENFCPERKKLLKVEFQCFGEPSYTVFLCERTNATLRQCRSQSAKMHIEYANYGRMDTTICTVGDKEEKNNRCRAGESLSIVAERCNGKSMCTIPSENSVFGDPCNGVFKYLETRFRCTEDNPTRRKRRQGASGFSYPSVTGYVQPYITTAQPVNHCNSISKHGLDWPNTEIGEIAKVSCIGDNLNTATWLCSNLIGNWDANGPYVADCPSMWVYDVKNRINNDNISATNIAKFLTVLTIPNKTVSRADLKNSVVIMKQLLWKQVEQFNNGNERQPKHISIEFNKAMLSIASNILDPSRRSTWQEPQDSSSNTTLSVFDVTSLLESCSFLIADQLSEDQSSPKISTENIDLVVAKINPGRKREDKFHFPILKNAEEKSDDRYRVGVPTNIPANATQITMSILIYNTIDTVLYPAQHGNDENKSIPIIASVVMGATVKIGAETVGDLGGEEIEFTLKHINNSLDGNTTCVFWDYDANDHVGGWATNGCRKTFTNQSETSCACSHLTNFAILMDVQGSHVDISEGHTVALELISIIGCSVSIMCLALCIMVFTCIKDLRNMRTSIHRNLCFSLMVAELLFLFGVNLTHLKLVCFSVAILLHYFFLTAFAWMCLEGVQLYIMLVRVFHTNNKILPFYLVGYGLPAVIVGVAAGFHPAGYGTEYYCWLSTDDGFIWSFTGPVLFIIVVNTIFLTSALRIAYSNSAAIQKDCQKNSNMKSWIKGALTLMFLLGITWVIGFTFIGEQTVVMAYIFTVLNSLQGLFIFFFHCVGNEKVKRELIRTLTRQAWVPKSIKKRLLTRGPRNVTFESSAPSMMDEGRRKREPKTTVTEHSDTNLVENNDDRHMTPVFFTNPMIRIHDFDGLADLPESPRYSWLHGHGVNEAKSLQYISSYPEPDY